MKNWIGWLLALVFILISVIRLQNLFNLGFGFDTNLFYLWGSEAVKVGYFNFWRDYAGFFDYMPGSVLLLIIVGKIAQIFSQTPEMFVVVLKVVNWLADIGLAGLIFYIARYLNNQTFVKSISLAVLTYSLPAIWFVSNVWGQIDSLVILFPLVAVILIYKAEQSSRMVDKFYFIAGIFFALGFWIKPQSILILPVLTLFYVFNRKWRSIAYQLTGFVITTILICWIPFTANSNRLKEVIMIPFTRSDNVSIGAATFWNLINASNQASDSLITVGEKEISIKIVGMALYFVTALLSVLIWIYRKNLGVNELFSKAKTPLKHLNLYDFAYIMSVHSIGYFLFMMKMHERYLHIGMVFSLVVLACIKGQKYFWIWFGLVMGLNLSYFLNLLATYAVNGYMTPGWVYEVFSSIHFNLWSLSSTLTVIVLLAMIGYGVLYLPRNEKKEVKN